MSVEFDQKIHTTLADANLQLAIYTATGRLKEKRIEAVSDAWLPDYQELRTQANAIKKHAIENLDHYLEEFERNVEARGGKVIYCKDATEVSDFVLSLAKERGSRLIVKSKSMTTEEVDLNERLEHHGLESVETDLGEYILQLAHEKPYHIVAPALHKTRYDVAEIFTRELHVANETVPEKQTVIAREVLREKFLHADIGISGANFLVADSGAVTLIENEGNARLTTSAPRIHIAVAGIEKVIPRAQDLAVFLKLLARSATGQLLSVYTSFLSGARRPGEVDGPEEFYVVLLDNGRRLVRRQDARRGKDHRAPAEQGRTRPRGLRAPRFLLTVSSLAQERHRHRAGTFAVLLGGQQNGVKGMRAVLTWAAAFQADWRADISGVSSPAIALATEGADTSGG